MEAGRIGDHMENATKPVETEKVSALELVLLLVHLTEEIHAQAFLLNPKGAS